MGRHRSRRALAGRTWDLAAARSAATSDVLSVGLSILSALAQLCRSGSASVLDLGTGLPTADNTHHVAQRAAPESRIVYVDHDPVVLSHARALLTSSPEGRTDYLQADLRDTRDILEGAARTLDLGRPVAILLIAVLHFILDADDPYAIVARLMDAVPSGSYLVMGHAASDIAPEASAEMARRYNAMSSASITPRTRDQVARFFDGLDLLPSRPGPHQPVGPGQPDRQHRRRPGRLLRHRPQTLIKPGTCPGQ